MTLKTEPTPTWLSSSIRPSWASAIHLQMPAPGPCRRHCESAAGRFDRSAQTRALLLGRDTWPGIAHAQDDGTVVPEEIEGDSASGLRVTQRIVSEIEQHLFHAVRIPLDFDRLEVAQDSGARRLPGPAPVGRHQAESRPGRADGRQAAGRRPRVQGRASQRPGGSFDRSRAGPRASVSWQSLNSLPDWRRSVSTLVRIPVSGVRSSCAASARKRRWVTNACSSRVSISLKVVASRPNSSCRGLGKPPREVRSGSHRPRRPRHTIDRAHGLGGQEGANRACQRADAHDY